MSVVATAAADWNEDDETNRRIALFNKLVVRKFGPTEPALLRNVQYITDLDKLEQILELSLTAAHFADLQAAIESAVPPPK